MKWLFKIGFVFSLLMMSCEEHESSQPKIIFICDVKDEYNQLCSINEDGTDLKVITEIERIRNFTFSPDGTKIAFRSKGDIYIVSTDGSNLINLTNDGYNPYDFAYSFYCEGNEIIYTRSKDIYIVGKDGSNNRKLIDNGLTNWLLAVSPDCRNIIYRSLINDEWKIYLNDVNNTSEKEIWENTNIYILFFSPDGEKIYFTYNDPNSDYEGSDIYTMNTDGLNIQKITNDNPEIGYFDISPNGKQIAYNSNKDGHRQIYIRNLDGSNPKNITNDLMKVKTTVSFSPDGKRIVYGTYFMEGYDLIYQIYTINTDGTNKTNITPDSINALRPTYQPFFE